MLSSAAWGAEQITEVQIINGLQGPAVTVVVDPAALMAEVNANVGKGAAALPSWAQLANLTQLVVDIEFEYNSTAIVPSSYRTLGAALARSTRHRTEAGSGTRASQGWVHHERSAAARPRALKRHSR
jgi:hypothetical protein